MTSIPFQPKTPNDTMRHNPPDNETPISTGGTRPAQEEILDGKIHNPLHSKQGKDHRPHLVSHPAVQQQMINIFLALLAHATPISNDETPLSQSINSQNFAQHSSPREEGHLRGDLHFPNVLPRKRSIRRRPQITIIALD